MLVTYWTSFCRHYCAHIAQEEVEREGRHATLLLDSGPELRCMLLLEAVGHWQPVAGQLELLQQMCSTYSLKSTEVIPLLPLIHCALDPLTWTMWCQYVDMPQNLLHLWTLMTFFHSASSFLWRSCWECSLISLLTTGLRSMSILMLHAKDSQMTWRVFLKALSSHTPSPLFRLHCYLRFFSQVQKTFFIWMPHPSQVTEDIHPLAH